MNITNDIKTIVLIALGVAGFGLLLFILNQNKDKYSQPETSSVKSFSLNHQYLILVIGAAKADVLNSLVINACPDYELCEILYQSTRFIWLGSKQQSASLFDELFTERVRVMSGEESEYDVYCVKLELRDYDSDGFNSGVSSVKRFDAFRKLADMSKIVSVSERLPASSYQNRNLYER